jgi:hypothetical protein
MTTTIQESDFKRGHPRLLLGGDLVLDGDNPLNRGVVTEATQLYAVIDWRDGTDPEEVEQLGPDATLLSCGYCAGTLDANGRCTCP